MCEHTKGVIVVQKIVYNLQVLNSPRLYATCKVRLCTEAEACLQSYKHVTLRTKPFTLAMRKAWLNCEVDATGGLEGRGEQTSHAQIARHPGVQGV